MLQTPVATALASQGYTTYSLSRGSCEIANVTPVVDGVPTTECGKFLNSINDLIKQVQPKIIVVSESDGTTSRNYLPAGVNSVSGMSRDPNGYWDAYKIALSNLKSQVAHLVVLGETPHLAKDTTDCVDSSGNFSSSCLVAGNDIDDVVQRAKNITTSLGGSFVDTRDWLCSNNSCPPIISNTLVYTDISHISYPFAVKLTPIITSYFRSII
jgi:hypothetical protein